MIKLITLAALVVCSQANAVVTIGRGASFTEALEQAKTAALEQTSGVMVLYSAKTENDKQTSTTKTYSSGVITSYTVLNSEMSNGSYLVTINADVKVGKNKMVLDEQPNDQDSVRQFQIAERSALAQKKFVKAFNDLPTFAVTYGAMKTVFHTAVVEHRFQYGVKWQPKLVSDVREYAELAGTKLKSPKDASSPYVLCFGDYLGASPFSCYGLATPIAGIDREYVVHLHATLIQTGEQIEDEAVLRDANLKFVSSRGTIVFTDGVATGEFVIYTKVGEGAVKLDSITVEPWRPAGTP